MMTESGPSIYRAEAVQRYVQSREKVVFPQFALPGIFVMLWILLALLLTGGLCIGLVRVPVYASGSALVTDADKAALPANSHPLVVTFLPAVYLSRLRTGHQLLLSFHEYGERLSEPIIAVEPEVLSPEEIERRFKPGNCMTQPASQPSVVVIARLESTPALTPASGYLGCSYHVDVEIGSRRIITLLPFVGNLFGE